MSRLFHISTMESDRAELIRRVLEKRLTQSAAAKTLGVTPRQMRRLIRAFQADGLAGLASKKRGAPSNRRLTEMLRRHALDLIREHYADFGPTLAREKLMERHGLDVGRETLRQWMMDDGIWTPRSRRGGRIQQPRGRRACFGELIQIDGCDHEWFEDRAERCVALVFVDDATGSLMWIQFCDSEATFEYFAAMRGYLERYGRPVALYSDKAAVFRSNRRTPGNVGDTQFGRAMRELNIDIICANTAAAKGRVERMHLTLQDRLVKELRLQGINTIEAANDFAQGEFLDSYNKRFARQPRSDLNAHRGPADVVLKDVFRHREFRKVSQSLTLHYKRRLYLLEPNATGRKAIGQTVEIFEDGEGNIEIRHKGVALSSAVFSKEGVPPSHIERQQGEVVPNKLLSKTLSTIKKKQIAKEISRIENSRSRREKKQLRRRLPKRRASSAGALPR